MGDDIEVVHTESLLHRAQAPLCSLSVNSPTMSRFPPEMMEALNLHSTLSSIAYPDPC